MNENINKNSDREIDEILAEVKKSKQNTEHEASEPSKTWSLDDIDRLIAEENDIPMEAVTKNGGVSRMVTGRM